MAALPETHNETVETVQDAARVAAESGEDDPDPGYRLVEPRPDVIKWKRREISLPDTDDADTWFLVSRRLDELEAGLLVREQYDEIPPRVEYSLTRRGEELAHRLHPLLKWAAEN